MALRFPALAALLLCGTAAAIEPAEYVSMPTVEYGEREFEVKLGDARKRGEAGISAVTVGVGFGMTRHWFTETYLKATREGDGSFRAESLEWENKFQITETGKYPFEVGFLAEIEIPRERSEGYDFRWGPLFQTEAADLQINANLIFTTNFGGREPARTVMGYQLQLKGEGDASLHLGFQAFGEMGCWHRWQSARRQSHRLGPALFGRIDMGDDHSLSWNVGYLVGISSGAPDRTFRLETELQF